MACRTAVLTHRHRRTRSPRTATQPHPPRPGQYDPKRTGRSRPGDGVLGAPARATRRPQRVAEHRVKDGGHEGDPNSPTRKGVLRGFSRPAAASRPKGRCVSLPPRRTNRPSGLEPTNSGRAQQAQTRPPSRRSGPRRISIRPTGHRRWGDCGLPLTPRVPWASSQVAIGHAKSIAYPVATVTWTRCLPGTMRLGPKIHPTPLTRCPDDCDRANSIG